MQMLRSTWNGVMQQTIANCFRQAQFEHWLCVYAHSDTSDVEEESDSNDEGFDDDDDNLPCYSHTFCGRT